MKQIATGGLVAVYDDSSLASSRHLLLLSHRLRLAFAEIKTIRLLVKTVTHRYLKALPHAPTLPLSQELLLKVML